MFEPGPQAASIEIASVTFAAFLVWASAFIQHFANVGKRGPAYVMSDRSVAPDMAGFFGRATRTLSNNIESGLMYAPVTLVVVGLGATGDLSRYAACAYIAARAVFSISYWLKIPMIRSFAWLAGMMCCAVMFYVAAAAVIGR